MPGFIICADNVSKVYGNGDAAQYALKHVSLSVPQGEFLSITGESGSGKSTLLNTILAQMQILCKTLPEYSVVRDMNCIGDVLAPRIIAEIGDVRRFKNKHALIAYAGIDAPPYQSGTFNASERKISKRGNSYLRKTGYEIMQSLIKHKPADDSVYDFIQKKRSEGNTRSSNRSMMNTHHSKGASRRSIIRSISAS